MQDTPLFDDFLDGLKSSVDGNKVEDHLTDTLIKWVGDTIEQSTVLAGLDGGRLQVLITTPDGLSVARDFDDVIGVGQYTHGDDREIAANLAKALRDTADRLEGDMGK